MKVMRRLQSDIRIRQQNEDAESGDRARQYNHAAE